MSDETFQHNSRCQRSGHPKGKPCLDQEGYLLIRPDSPRDGGVEEFEHNPLCINDGHNKWRWCIDDEGRALVRDHQARLFADGGTEEP